MKKILLSIATLAVVASTVNADFTRVEIGAGSWAQSPKGYINVTDGEGALNLDGKYTSNETQNNGIYVWAFIKHPVPIVPNLRLEYVTLEDQGDTTGKVGGLTIPASAPTTFDITQFDIVPYYNILDNTFWTTIDLGLDIKVVQTDATVSKIDTGIPTTSFTGYNSSETTAIPLLYVRGRVQIPLVNIGLEADVKALSYSGNTMYDARAKVDYTLDITPLIQPAFEVGYRVQQLTVDDGSNQIDLNYAGVYAGLMLRF